MTHLLRLVGKYRGEIALGAATLLIGNVLFEIGYRAYQYVTLPDRLFAEMAQRGPLDRTNTGYLFDPHTGYRYRPDDEGRRGAPWFSHWRTNSHGHVARADYPQRKPAGEYRIAVVGDSFTAGITNTVRWTDLLEDQLNGSPDWTASVNGRRTRVINFAVDGMGLIQMTAMARHYVPDFEPDLVMASFVTDDILRRLRFMNVPGQSADRDTLIRAYVKTNYLDAINWFRPYPELFAATIGHFFGMRPQLPIDHRLLLAYDPAFKFNTRAEGIRESAAAVRALLAVRPDTLFLHAPMFQELAGWRIPEWDGLMREFLAAIPELPVIAMQPRLEPLLDGKRVKDRPDLAGLNVRQLMALPPQRQPELYRWFFLGDFHPTDYGATLYAEEVAKLLLDRAKKASSE
jgi:GDSL-like Lipase/Acylhydrolase